MLPICGRLLSTLEPLWSLEAVRLSENLLLPIPGSALEALGNHRSTPCLPAQHLGTDLESGDLALV